MRTAATYLLYWAGCFFIAACDAAAEDFPREEWAADLLYKAYSALMWWSSELDTHEVCWLKRRPGETHEQFEQRTHERWPEETL